MIGSGLYLLVAAVVVVGPMLWRWQRASALKLHDLYPLYYEARAWLSGGNAYDLLPAVPHGDAGLQLFEIGNGSSLPVVLLVMPLARSSAIA